MSEKEKPIREIQFLGDQISKQPQALYEKMLRTIADKYDIDISLIVCHGKYDVVPAEMSFDKLYIFSQLLPKEFEGVKKATVKGFRMGGEDVLFPIEKSKDGEKSAESPCPQGDSLVFGKIPTRAIVIPDEAGVPMAVILDGCLYIVNDFNHSRSKADFEVGSIEFEYILKKAIAAGLIDQVKGGLEEKSKRALEAALRIQFTTRLEKELIQLKAAIDTVVQYEKGIVDATRKKISTEKIVETIRKHIDEVEPALEKTWKSLEKMTRGDLYTSISYTKNGIKAITTPVTVKYNKKEYSMGRFEVSLSYYEGSCKIHSLDNKVNDTKHDHPHVLDGNVCWGNFSGQIPKLIGSSDFDVALNMIYTFLCHYDSGNPYRKIEDWPTIEKRVIGVKEMEVLS